MNGSTQDGTQTEQPAASLAAAAPPVEDGQGDGTPRAGTSRRGSRKGGAPPYNRNSMKHGLYSTPEQQSWRLVMGMLPKMLASVEDAVYTYRAFLEEAVVESHGHISRTAAHQIDAAAKWYRHGLICQKLMRDTAADADLTAAQKRDAIERLSEKTCKAAEGRDKAIAALRLEQAAENPWDALYALESPQLPLLCDSATLPDPSIDPAKVASQSEIDTRTPPHEK